MGAKGMVFQAWAHETHNGFHFNKIGEPDFLHCSVVLNQALQASKPAHTWFLEIAFIWKANMCVYVCVSAIQAMKNHSIHVK